MEAYFAFTDECGNYQKIRSDSFKQSHPFYVRSTVIISLVEYLQLQKETEKTKALFGLNQNVEVKWSHFGSALKNNYKKIAHRLTPGELMEYYTKVLSLLCTLSSVTIYYTLTDNSLIGQVGEIALLKMHLQNAYQRIQSTLSEKDGFAIVVADDLNDKTKALKQAVYELTIAGDYVQYTNIKKGLYIDFSDQCHGLQIADICAGIFTTSLKYENSPTNEKHKYELGRNLFFSHAYKKTRSSFFHAPYYDVYKFGVKEVPNGAGETIAREVSHQIEKQLESDLMHELYDLKDD